MNFFVKLFRWHFDKILKTACLFALFSLFLFHSPSSIAIPNDLPAPQPPLSTGLPESLPLNFFAQEKFVVFTQAPNTFQAPIAINIFFNDQPVSINDRITQALVFSEFFLAKLPPGAPIQVGKNSNNLTVWDYPVGTQVIHLITLKSSPLQVFELRMVQKLTTGQWAFGLYSPTPQGYILNHYSGVRPDGFSVHLTSGQSMNVKLSHLNLQSCRNCHFTMSPSKYQYPSVDLAGPCGFAPANSGLYTDWAEKYLRIHRERPFATQPRIRF